MPLARADRIRSLLIVGNDEVGASLVGASLKDQIRMAVYHEADPTKALELIRTPDLGVVAVLIYSGRREGQSEQICRTFRDLGVLMPLIILSHSPRESDIVAGLDAGADDFLCVPCRSAELAARVRAHLRAYEMARNAVFQIGPFTFRPAGRQLTLKGHPRPIRLTDRENTLLLFLCRARGQFVARADLLMHVWGYSRDAATHTVETHIYRLRRKFATSPDCQELIAHEDGGYCLRTDVPRTHSVTHAHRRESDSSGTFASL